jgi:hypothetical protein
VHIAAKPKLVKKAPSPGQTPVFELKITLRGIRPPIWRRIRVGGHHTLAEFHEILQEVMGWTNTHLHKFEIGGRYFVPADMEDEGVDIEGEDESAITLADAVHLAGKSFRYDYDFGDGWEHTIQVEKVLPAEAQPPVPVCLAGARRCPPEDCGGTYGYQQLLEALRDPANPQHTEMREWIADLYGSEARFHPEAFSTEAVNQSLQHLAKRKPNRISTRR